ncbi:LptA/OstA family protein [Candidatus Nitronereus thalassa]|uniref:LptA/OstA family protein n=1 Tax=Candidatus Nitronereus thalassa TaxID=3020898 RepID=A0ABU3KBL2_9BACT|nr:LptA/OstA family protein [Candidatus Nitronereus thalassa]MDT7043826.1 LptA/OstA family protein [Candidatus Nitronereus thalassa]
MSNPRRNLLSLSKVLLVIGVLWWGLFDAAGFAAPRNPTTITSGTMTAQGKSRKAIFEKSVVLTRDNMVIRADRMIVYFKKDSPGKSDKSSDDSFGQQVDVVDAQGHVIIEKEDGKATSGRAVYYKDEEKVVLTDSPVAWQNGTRVTGTKMTIFLKEERSIVEGGSRVVIEESEGEQ